MIPDGQFPYEIHSPGPSSSESRSPTRSRSISPSFGPTARHDDGGCPPDMILLSLDSVLFYVHSHVLIAAHVFTQSFKTLDAFSAEGEAGFPTLNVPGTSLHINVILHAIYGIDGLKTYHYSVQDLITAIDDMPIHNLTPNKVITPSNPLHTLLEYHAHLFPMDIFALAAHHNIETLAIVASSFLHSYPLLSVSDELADRMGPVYLRRLFSLHTHLSTALRSTLLVQPVAPKSCGSIHQSELTRLWALTTAYFAWNPQPGITKSNIESTINPLKSSLRCAKCVRSLDERTTRLVSEWDSVKKTI